MSSDAETDAQIREGMKAAFGQYTCEACGRTLEKTRSDADAYAEAKARWPVIEPIKGAAIVCDDCHAEMLEWAAAEGIL